MFQCKYGEILIILTDNFFINPHDVNFSITILFAEDDKEIALKPYVNLIDSFIEATL